MEAAPVRRRELAQAGHDHPRQQVDRIPDAVAAQQAPRARPASASTAPPDQAADQRRPEGPEDVWPRGPRPASRCRRRTARAMNHGQSTLPGMHRVDDPHRHEAHRRPEHRHQQPAPGDRPGNGRQRRQQHAVRSGRRPPTSRLNDERDQHQRGGRNCSSSASRHPLHARQDHAGQQVDRIPEAVAAEQPQSRAGTGMTTPPTMPPLTPAEMG